jgi:hypothetical protein
LVGNGVKSFGQFIYEYSSVELQNQSTRYKPLISVILKTELLQQTGNMCEHFTLVDLLLVHLNHFPFSIRIQS